MGAWGQGPFDNDTALDFLGGLTNRHAATVSDDDATIVPASVDHEAVTLALTTALADAAEGADDYQHLEAYAAAGLVAAVRAGHSADEPSGTRLFAAMAAADGPGGGDLLGLESHCGFVALLSPDDAEALAPAARAAVEALAAAPSWKALWRLGNISPTMTALVAALS